jgi:aminoglycoside N3'-acetyltransferase
MTAALPRAALQQQLRELGVGSGAVLLVHSAFSRVGPVEGGPSGLIAALLDAVGRDGTVVMPSWGDDGGQLFDPAVTPCRALGVVPDTFWRLPGVVRGANPHAFAARGPAAAALTRDQPVDLPHGPDSPVGRVHARDGLILLLGVGHAANTTVHLAEYLAGVRYRRPQSVTVLRNGVPTRVDYMEIDHCCARFTQIDGWLDAADLQRRGPVGRAPARLMRSAALVDVVTARLRATETAFLHPYGVDAECDEAWDSLPDGGAAPR